MFHKIPMHVLSLVVKGKFDSLHRNIVNGASVHQKFAHQSLCPSVAKEGEEGRYKYEHKYATTNSDTNTDANTETLLDVNALSVFLHCLKGSGISLLLPVLALSLSMQDRWHQWGSVLWSASSLIPIYSTLSLQARSCSGYLLLPLANLGQF